MTDIKAVLEPLRTKLDEWVRAGAPGSEPVVVLSNIAEHDGRQLGAARDKVVISVLSLHTDPLMTAGQSHLAVSGLHGQSPQPVVINLNLLIVANYSDANYADGLSALSRCIAFFQRYPVLHSAQLPDLPGSLDRITLEFINLDFGQLNSIFSALGAKVLPSVLYRLRSIPFTAEPQTFAPLVAEPSLSPAP